MRLFESEADRRDRARLLLKMCRIDIDRIAPGSQVQVFEPVWRQNPKHLALGAAVGLALVHDSQSEKGIEVLCTVLQQHPESARAWDSWLTGLDDSYQPDRLAREFARLPPALLTDLRLAKHEGTVAQGAVTGQEPSRPTGVPVPSNLTTGSCYTASEWLFGSWGKRLTSGRSTSY